MEQDDRTQIACESSNWEFKCPKRWDELDETDRLNVRYCPDCKRRVYLCSNADQLNHWSRLGKCIAWNAGPSPDDLLVATIGLVEMPYELKQFGSDEGESQ